MHSALTLKEGKFSKKKDDFIKECAAAQADTADLSFTAVTACFCFSVCFSWYSEIVFLLLEFMDHLIFGLIETCDRTFQQSGP